jgi:hopanoid C-3 methylase
VLLRNEEVFRRWRRLGLNYMFLGPEAQDEEGLAAFRKRTTPKVNNKALEVARSMGLSVAINIIADPDRDEARQARYLRRGHPPPRQSKRRTATSPAFTPTSAAEPGRC